MSPKKFGAERSRGWLGSACNGDDDGLLFGNGGNGTNAGGANGTGGTPGGADGKAGSP